MSRVVHQFVPRLEPGAVGSHVLGAQRALRARGYVSEIFAAETDDRWTGRAQEIDAYGSRYPMRDSDMLIYQYAIGSPVADVVQTLPGVLIVNSHTQTPPELLDGWDPAGQFAVQLGKRQLARLAGTSRLGIAVSGHNAAELHAAGFTDVVVVPVFTDPVAVAPDPVVATTTIGTRWLFVGRVAPNKQHHKLVQSFAWYRAAYDPEARLVVVGGGTETRYGRAVQRYVVELGLEDAVAFTGTIGDAQLAAQYAAADVYVCLSAHEGFCVPLLEAMRAGVPIVALAATAVPETVADAGVLLDSDRPSVVAAAVERVRTDGELRAELIDRGHARAQDFDADRVGSAFIDAIESIR